MYCEKCDKLGLEFCKCKTSRLIAGHIITLEVGKRYLATRPMMIDKNCTAFPVTIKEIDGEPVQVIQVIENLDYNQANQFINEFNNELLSFNGRIW